MKRQILIAAVLMATVASFASAGVDFDRGRTGIMEEILGVEPAVPAAPQEVEGNKARSVREFSYRSYGMYRTDAEASIAFQSALRSFESAGLQIVDKRLVSDNFSYFFAIKYKAVSPVQVYTSGKTFLRKSEAVAALSATARGLISRGNKIAATEVFQQGSEFAYVIAYINAMQAPVTGIEYYRGYAPVSGSGIKLESCRLVNMNRDTCFYKCAGGVDYEMPAREPSPWDDRPVIPCPQLLFQF